MFYFLYEGDLKNDDSKWDRLEKYRTQIFIGTVIPTSPES